MTKIGVISIWDIDNYGNRLQNYAMQSALRQIGYEAETLKMWPQKKWKRVFQFITNCDVSVARDIYELCRGNKRKVNFLRFERRYIKKNRRFLDEKEDVSYLNKQYDGFVLGSDQIWNPVFLNQAYYFGGFANNDKKVISYAASIGVSQLEDNELLLLEKGLQTVKHISVREERAAEIIEKLVEKKPQVVIDPTMLIDASEWEKLEKKPRFITGDYIVLYYLGSLSKEWMTSMKNLCKEKNYQLIVLGNAKYKDFYTVGPSEFLFLIHHAKLVCTDSFHGCCFSILYQTPFHVFERENSPQKMNSRIDTLMDTFCLQNRKIEERCNKLNIQCDYSKTNHILACKREEGFRFLKTSLE